MNYLNLPERTKKPRNKGMNSLIDNGYSTVFFEGVINSFEKEIDFVKFGWGTSVVSANIQDKISILKNNNIDFCLGGTLFEKYFIQNKVDNYKKLLDFYQCEYMEVSNGTIDMSNTEKCEYIYDFAKSYKVFSEVGLKDSVKSEEMHPKLWIKYIKEDLDSGSVKVITEARESGNSGICRSNGDLRIGLIEEILDSEIAINDIIFEAPNKALQAYFINKLGANCNLANIPFTDIISLETLRLGLRSDTFYTFENGSREKL